MASSDWTYDLYGLKDDSDSVETIENLSLASRLNQLLQAPDGGISLCEGGFNPFGLANSTAISEECQQFMAPDDVSTLMSIVTCTKARLPGRCSQYRRGDVKASLGAVYREDSVNYIPSISIVTNDALGLNPSNPSSGETETSNSAARCWCRCFLNA